MNLSYEDKSNIDQIKALRSSLVKSDRVAELLDKRVRLARTNIGKLRAFALKGDQAKGTSKHCHLLANELEKKLSEALR